MELFFTYVHTISVSTYPSKTLFVCLYMCNLSEAFVVCLCFSLSNARRRVWPYYFLVAGRLASLSVREAAIIVRV